MGFGAFIPYYESFSRIRNFHPHFWKFSKFAHFYKKRAPAPSAKIGHFYCIFGHYFEKKIFSIFVKKIVIFFEKLEKKIFLKNNALNLTDTSRRGQAYDFQKGAKFENLLKVWVKIWNFSKTLIVGGEISGICT